MSSSSTSDLPTLYTFYRSSCSYRVRIALNLKRIEYKPVYMNLEANEQIQGEPHTDEFRKISPFGYVPAFVDNKSGKTMVESISIIEYLDEVYPEYPLLPKDPADRAAVRAIVFAIAMDIQPIANMRILRYVGDGKSDEWGKHFITEGFKAVEAMLAKSAGDYAFGNSLTMADVALVPQVRNAERSNVDMSAFPTIARLNKKLLELPEFQIAHPFRQFDCPEDLKVTQ
ncbi:glutathione S-transferase [Mortierella sp. GBAus27b]|nr:glutathione S-transferase [Mortierella sp. GBAus27b]